MSSHIAIIGLGTMGANLARNIASRGWNITVYNRHWEKTEAFLQEVRSEKSEVSRNQEESPLLRGTDSPQVKQGDFVGAKTIQELVESLAKPRKIMLMISAGKAVDEINTELLPFLEPGDIIIDGGNSQYRDTVRREKDLAEKGISFVGCGVSGGHEGALKGPSMMFGGSKEAWEQLKEILQSIAARDIKNQPCVSYLGNSGAGHAVKMIHNGIEYAIMQLFSESYALMKQEGKTETEIGDIFEIWNQDKLNGYLSEIAAKVLHKKDEFSDEPILKFIKDVAKQKGTGKWTSEAGLTWNIPLPSITSAVEARFHSEKKEEREILSKLYPVFSNDYQLTTNDSLENTLHFLIICIFIQGIKLLEAISKNESLEIDIAESLRVWQGGCIIRMKLLVDLHEMYSLSHEEQTPLLASPELIRIHERSVADLKNILTLLLEKNIPAACHFATYEWFLSSINNPLPTTLIQGMRDYFGAHTYERTDREGTFTTNWDE